MDATKQAAGFLSALFHEKPETHHILIWQLNKSDGKEKKRQDFFTKIEDAAVFATGAKPIGTNVYFGVGTLTEKPPRGRGKLDLIGGIGAVHLDVDVQATGAHKKQNLPPTIDAAIEFVNAVGLSPSIVVNSGYGLHVYWLLQNFWLFDNPQKRTDAGKLIETWQRMFKWRAGHHGWDVDATQDLTRVLRVPGTLNQKPDTDTRTAKLIKFDPSTRYTASDFENVLEGMRGAATSTPLPAPAVTHTQQKPLQQVIPIRQDQPRDSWQSIKIDIDENATVPNDMFEALSDNVTKFKQTWQRKRKDLQDSSASSYDMALANIAIGAGLPDQIVANLLISHRRKYADEKLRKDYLQRTIFEAREGMRQQREVKQAANAPIDPNDKESIRNHLQRIFGFRIVKLEKQLTDPPQFIIHFPDGRYKNIGDAYSLIDQKTFRRHVANTINHYVPQMKEMLWEPAAQKLLSLAEEIEVAFEATELGEASEIVNAYLSELTPFNISLQQHRQVITHGQPAIIDGVPHLHALELWKYAKRNYGSKLAKKDFVALLRRLKAERQVLTVRDERGKVCCVSVFAMPHDFDFPLNVRKEMDRLLEAGTDEDED
jgi:hypothetical protein